MSHPYAVELGFRQVAVSAKTVWIVLRLRLDCGAEGWAEVSDFGAEAGLAAGLAALARAIAETRPAVPGDLPGLLRGRQGAARLDGLRHGLQAAAADALARRAGLTLGAYLGGGFRADSACYANINRGIADRSPQGFAAHAAAVVAMGYEAVKIAPFDGYLWDRVPDPALRDAGMARAHAVRAAIGPARRLLIDCHARFAPPEAARIIDALAEADPYWIEEPVDARRTDAPTQRRLRAAAHRHGIRIAGGEDVTGLADALPLLAAGGLDAILPDLRLTGLRGGLAVLDAALAQGVEPSLHNPAGPVLDAMTRHLAVAVDADLLVERQVAETPHYDRIAGGALALRGGRIGLGGGAGIGMTPRFDGPEDSAAAAPTGGLGFAGMAGAGPDA